MECTIGKACLDDGDEILLVINTSNRAAFKSIIPKEYFREPVLSAEDLLENFQRMTFYVCKTEGRIVGVAALYVESEGIGRIRWVYVLPQYQRKGIGTALLTHLEREAGKMDLKRLRLLTAEKAYWAVNFYVKLGYSVTDRIERPWGFDVSLEKELSETPDAIFITCVSI